MVAGARRVERIEALAGEIDGTAHHLDVADPDSVAAFCAAVHHCRLLVNNAGGALGVEPLAQAVDHKWITMFETNVLGLMRMTRGLLPRLVESGDGHVVNVTSIAGIQGYPGGSGYNAAKFGAHGVTESLRHELLGQPVRVTEVLPGLVETEFSVVRFDGDADRADRVYAGLTPLTADDVAECVRWAAALPSHVNIDRSWSSPATRPTPSVPTAAELDRSSQSVARSAAPAQGVASEPRTSRSSSASTGPSPWRTLTSPVVSRTTARTWSSRRTFASRSLAITSCLVTRAAVRFSSRIRPSTISRSGSLSTTRAPTGDRRRSWATSHWHVYSTTRARIPLASDVDDDATVAMIEPVATVTAKSKLDILENERSPTTRATTITAAKTATADTATSQIWVQSVESQESIMGPPSRRWRRPFPAIRGRGATSSPTVTPGRSGTAFTAKQHAGHERRPVVGVVADGEGLARRCRG